MAVELFNNIKTCVGKIDGSKIIDAQGQIIGYTDENENYGSITLTAKARLPKYEEISAAGCDGSGTCPLWLANYLGSSSYVTGTGVKNLSNMRGYWLLSTNKKTPTAGSTVNYNGALASRIISDYGYGVRPVISVKKASFY